MANYTIGQLAKLAGVSVRTLHHYDSKGLLKPVRTGQKGAYRTYGKEQLLRLQQILFYKELEFPLVKIKTILCMKDFDLVHSLKSQKQMFLNKISRQRALIDTIDLTIKHLEEGFKMENKQFFDSFFNPSEEVLLERRITGLKILGKTFDLESLKKSVKKEVEDDKLIPPQKLESIKKEMYSNMKKVVDLIGKGSKEDSEEVQTLIAVHYKQLCNFTPAPYNRNNYAELAIIYGKHPDCIALFGQYHPSLAEFISKAMIIWAEKNLE